MFLAVGTLYLVLVPRLEEKLVDTRISELKRTAPTLRQAVLAGASQSQFQQLAAFASTQSNARVTLLRSTDGGFVTVADSRIDAAATDLTNDAFARQAMESGQVVDGRVSTNDVATAKVAVPITNEIILLVSTPLTDQLAAVRIVRRDLIIAGGIALAVSYVLGALAGLVLTRRVRRLEYASTRIARGDFDVQVAEEGADEIAQLSQTFDRMRLRLASLDRARREFIANASHELRTPIFALGGFLELLVDEDLGAGTRQDFIESMREQVDRLTRLTTDLLDLSRVDAGGVGVEHEPVNLTLVAEELASEFRASAEASQHKITSLGGRSIMAVGDDQWVLRIGRLLVENALRHTPAGCSVVVSARMDDFAELIVEDDGPGIDEAERDLIFERFYRSDRSTAFGSGLGLSISRELAHEMQGELRLDSQSGRTEFILQLPAVTEPIEITTRMPQ